MRIVFIRQTMDVLPKHRLPSKPKERQERMDWFQANGKREILKGGSKKEKSCILHRNLFPSPTTKTSLASRRHRRFGNLFLPTSPTSDPRTRQVFGFRIHDLPSFFFFVIWKTKGQKKKNRRCHRSVCFFENPTRGTSILPCARARKEDADARVLRRKARIESWRLDPTGTFARRNRFYTWSMDGILTRSFDASYEPSWRRIEPRDFRKTKHWLFAMAC